MTRNHPDFLIAKIGLLFEMRKESSAFFSLFCMRIWETGKEHCLKTGRRSF